MVTVTESFRVRPYEVHIMIVMDTSYPSGLLHCHWGNMTTAHWGNMTIALVRVATELAKKDSWTFPWLFPDSWWRCQMETFSAVLALCEGKSPVTSEFPSQRPVMRSFDFFFDLRLNKQLSKQSRHWWFETPSRSIILSSMTTMSLQVPTRDTITTNVWTKFQNNPSSLFWVTAFKPFIQQVVDGRQWAVERRWTGDHGLLWYTRTTFETPKYPQRPRDQYTAQIVNTLELSAPHQIEFKKKTSPTW